MSKLLHVAQGQTSWKDILVCEIQKKKELKALTPTVILCELEKVIISNPSILKHKVKNISLIKGKDDPNLLDTLIHTKSKEFKMLLKLTRERMRRTYGLFRARDSSELDEALSAYLKNPSVRNVQTLLGLHESTKERKPIYPTLYSDIFSSIVRLRGQEYKQGVRIVDLACGLNPISVSVAPLKVIKYVGYDINTKEIDVLNHFFSSRKKNSVQQWLAIVGDIRSCEIEKGDVAFCFKILDVIDRNSGHTRSETLLSRIPCRFVVASFATKTMSGKPMTAPKRRWMEWLCHRLGWAFEILEFENEIFYIIDKGPN